MSKALANHINAMHLARQAFIECESDRVLKAALKQKVYQRGDNVKQGDWIYFKQNIKSGKSKWEGPVKVVAKDRKTLYVVRGGRFLSINSDDSQLAAFEGSFESNGDEAVDKKGSEISEKESMQEVANEKNKNDKNKNNSIVTGSDSNNRNINSTTSVSKDTHLESSAQSETVTEDEEITEVDMSSSPSVSSEVVKASDENIHDTTSEVESTDKIKNPYTALKLKRNDLIRYKEEDEWVEVQLTSRAGKVGSKYDSWWNIKNLKTGHESHEDLSSKLFIERIESQNKADEKDVVYVVQIPRYRHHESICKEAKERELSSWDEFEVYQVVEDEGQARLGTNWVLTEKRVDNNK